MSDVTPEELRALADIGIQTDDGYNYTVPATYIVAYNEQLRAAADALQAAEADRDALARKIAAAPHGAGCSWYWTAAGLSCTCWKADTGDAAHQGVDK